MSSTLIQNATLLTCERQSDGQIDLTPQRQDVLIQSDRIAQIAPQISPPVGAIRVDATDQLLLPGWVNAHAHSAEILEKGCFEAMPLEIWMLYSYSPMRSQGDPERLCYLRTLVGAIESLKSGCTTIQDDLYGFPYTTAETYGAVAQAYCDAGTRVSLSHHCINQPLYKTLPYVESLLPADLKQELDAIVGISDEDWIDLFKHLHQTWHGKQGLVTTILAPSASQRVTPEMMHRIAALSESLDLPIHTHLLETRTQAITGPELFGESVVSYAKRHGILTHRTAIAHGIWLTPEDIELIAEAGATVIHNIVSNYRLASGIAPIMELQEAGVTIALGSDGMCSNDSFNMFDVLKAAGLTHSIPEPNLDRYPRAADVLRWATYGGARSALLQDQVGSITVGKQADLVLYDLHSLSFTPTHSLPIHLVYCERGNSIRKVFVNGQLVVEDGRVLTVDEAEILRELREYLPAYRQERQIWSERSRRFQPILEQMYRQVMAQPFPVNRFTRDERYWTPVQTGI